MKLEKLTAATFFTRSGPPGDAVVDYAFHEQYRDADTGQLYLLTKEQAHELDPRWPLPSSAEEPSE